MKKKKTFRGYDYGDDGWDDKAESLLGDDRHAG
jgi:hypothetical protein